MSAIIRSDVCRATRAISGSPVVFDECASCRRIIARVGVLLLCLCLASCATIVRPNYRDTVTELRAGEYTLDQDHVYVLFRIGHLDLSTVVGRFNAVRASLDFDPQQLTAMRLDGVLDTASIDLGNSDLERRLRGADWLDTERFPEATFVTREVMQVQGNQFRITGDFTLHGVTRALTLDATFNGGADNLLTGKYTLGFSATGQIKRSDFGIDALAALVADTIDIEIHAEFQRN